MFVLQREIKRREKGIADRLQSRYQDPGELNLLGLPLYVWLIQVEFSSSSVHDLSIDPGSCFMVVLNPAIPQSLDMQLAEGNALEVSW